MADEPKTDPPKANGADNSIVIQLEKAVPGGEGEDVMELKFREPTAADIERCGTPIMLDYLSDPPKMTYEIKAMFSMMSTLAAVPPSTIKKMSTKDWEWAAALLAHRFFMPGV